LSDENRAIFIGVLKRSGGRLSASVVKLRKISNIKHLSAVLDPICKNGAA
jgi:hypothetical protein